MAIIDYRLPLYTDIIFETQGPAYDVFNQEMFGQSYVAISVSSAVNVTTTRAVNTAAVLNVGRTITTDTDYTVIAPSTLSYQTSFGIARDAAVTVYVAPPGVEISFTGVFTKAVGFTGIGCSTNITFIGTNNVSTSYAIKHHTRFWYSVAVSTMTTFPLRINGKLSTAVNTTVAKSTTIRTASILSYANLTTVVGALPVKGSSRFSLSVTNTKTAAISFKTTSRFVAITTTQINKSVPIINGSVLSVNANHAVNTTKTLSTAAKFYIVSATVVQGSATFNAAVRFTLGNATTITRTYAIASPYELKLSATNDIKGVVTIKTSAPISYTTNATKAIGIVDLINEHITSSVTFNLSSMTVVSKHITGLATENKLPVTSTVSVQRTIYVSSKPRLLYATAVSRTGSMLPHVNATISLSAATNIAFIPTVRTATSLTFSSITDHLTDYSVNSSLVFHLTENVGIKEAVCIKNKTLLNTVSYTDYDSNLTVRCNVGLLYGTGATTATTLVAKVNSNFALTADKTITSTMDISAPYRLVKQSAFTMSRGAGLKTDERFVIANSVRPAPSSISLGGAVRLSFESSFTIIAKPWRTFIKHVDINLVKNDINVEQSTITWTTYDKLKLQRV